MATRGKTSTEADTYGVLVGWKHHEFADKLDLSLQTKAAGSGQAIDAVDTFHVVMTQQQATVLANYLFKVTGATLPEPKKGRIRRWFGG